MTNEMYRRAVKVLLKQARYDQPKRFHCNFFEAYVIGPRIFLTEKAAKGWPNRNGYLVELVSIEEAIEYAKENPHIVEEIKQEV